MATNKLHKFELDVLLAADKELLERGHTEQKCPRCGNSITCEEKQNSYIIRCLTENCIKTEFRGIKTNPNHRLEIAQREIRAAFLCPKPPQH